jgi:hypothetical protein
MKSQPGRRKHFDRTVRRRREIEAHARHVGAADTDDLSRWLIAWVWHNWQSKDQINALMECARRMGHKRMSPAEALEIIEEASITRKCWSADSLARFLGLKYRDRQTLGITTIGSIDVGKRARRVLRQRNDRLYQECRRRARGARPRSESLSVTKPWDTMNISRRTWERRRNKGRDASSSAAVFLSSGEESASVERKREFEGAAGAAQASSPPDGATMAVDDRASVYGELPGELRLFALGLGGAKIFGPEIGVAA